jgi:peroxiredoxin Q/BCP
MMQDQLERRTIVLAFTTALVLTMMAAWFIVGPFGSAIAAEGSCGDGGGPAATKSSSAMKPALTSGDEQLTMERSDVKVGEAAPDFSLPMYPKGTFTLSEHLGETVVLYFYPGDDTPVCTRQAVAFRDLIDDFEAAGAKIYGVSADSYESHAAFAKKYNLPFPLMVDDGGAVREMYGQPDGADEVQGRITYIIDRDGIVRHTIQEEEDMPRHVTEALEWAQKLATDTEDRD